VRPPEVRALRPLRRGALLGATRRAPGLHPASRRRTLSILDESARLPRPSLQGNLLPFLPGEYDPAPVRSAQTLPPPRLDAAPVSPADEQGTSPRGISAGSSARTSTSFSNVLRLDPCPRPAPPRPRGRVPRFRRRTPLDDFAAEQDADAAPMLFPDREGLEAHSRPPGPGTCRELENRGSAARCRPRERPIPARPRTSPSGPRPARGRPPRPRAPGEGPPCAPPPPPPPPPRPRTRWSVSRAVAACSGSTRTTPF